MHEAHDALTCIGNKTYIHEKNRIKYSDQHYLKSSDEMIKLFSDLPEALENNYNLIFKCNFRILFYYKQNTIRRIFRRRSYSMQIFYRCCTVCS